MILQTVSRLKFLERGCAAASAAVRRNCCGLSSNSALGKLNHDSDCRARRIRFSSGVLQLRAFCKYWLPVLIWMALIFTASSDAHSYEHSSRILEPLLHWLFPHMPADTVDRIIHHLLRKCAHLTEYAVLALLLWRALRKPVKNDPRPWNWREAGSRCCSSCSMRPATNSINILCPRARRRCRTCSLTPAAARRVCSRFGLIGRWRKRW